MLNQVRYSPVQDRNTTTCHMCSVLQRRRFTHWKGLTYADGHQHSEDIPWLRQLNISLLIRRPLFDPRPFRGSFMMGNVALCRFPLPLLRHPIVSVNPNMFYHRHYLNLVIENAFNRTLFV